MPPPQRRRATQHHLRMTAQRGGLVRMVVEVEGLRPRARLRVARHRGHARAVDDHVAVGPVAPRVAAAASGSPRSSAALSGERGEVHLEAAHLLGRHRGRQQDRDRATGTARNVPGCVATAPCPARSARCASARSSTRAGAEEPSRDGDHRRAALYLLGVGDACHDVVLHGEPGTVIPPAAQALSRATRGAPRRRQAGPRPTRRRPGSTSARTAGFSLAAAASARESSRSAPEHRAHRVLAAETPLGHRAKHLAAARRHVVRHLPADNHGATAGIFPGFQEGRRDGPPQVPAIAGTVRATRSASRQPSRRRSSRR